MENKETEEKSLGSFLRDTKAEFGRISWPPRRELFESTWAVAAMLLALSIFVLVCDLVVKFLLELIWKIG